MPVAGPQLALSRSKRLFFQGFELFAAFRRCKRITVKGFQFSSPLFSFESVNYSNTSSLTATNLHRMHCQICRT